MSMSTDLVRDSKLTTQILNDEYCVHTHYESDPTSRKRAVPRLEYWRRQKVIGRGSYGSVRLERCVKGERDLQVRAVKQISTARQRTSKPLDYARELEAIMKFSQPKYERCFVKAFGWYESADSLFIAMEYLEHGDLDNFLLASAPIDEDAAGEITFQVLEGLSFMHENSFAHRDLKPANILIKSEPPDMWIKIADFGLTKRVEDELGITNTLKGTMGFIAPELHGFTARTTDYATDIWALGEIAYQMVTKQPTFCNLAKLFKYVQGIESFPEVHLHERGIGTRAIDFICMTMAPLPASRPTADRGLAHPWLSSFAPESPTPELPEGEPRRVSNESDRSFEASGVWTTISDTFMREQTTMKAMVVADKVVLAESSSDKAHSRGSNPAARDPTEIMNAQYASREQREDPSSSPSSNDKASVGNSLHKPMDMTFGEHVSGHLESERALNIREASHATKDSGQLVAKEGSADAKQNMKPKIFGREASPRAMYSSPDLAYSVPPDFAVVPAPTDDITPPGDRAQASALTASRNASVAHGRPGVQPAINSPKADNSGVAHPSPTGVVRRKKSGTSQIPLQPEDKTEKEGALAALRSGSPSPLTQRSHSADPSAELEFDHRSGPFLSHQEARSLYTSSGSSPVHNTLDSGLGLQSTHLTESQQGTASPSTDLNADTKAETWGAFLARVGPEAPLPKHSNVSTPHAEPPNNLPAKEKSQTTPTTGITRSDSRSRASIAQTDASPVPVPELRLQGDVALGEHVHSPVAEEDHDQAAIISANAGDRSTSLSKSTSAQTKDEKAKSKEFSWSNTMKQMRKKWPKKGNKPPDSIEPAEQGHIFGVDLSTSIRYANVAISLMDEVGNSYVYGYIPIIVAKCGVYLKDIALDTPGLFTRLSRRETLDDMEKLFDYPDRYGKGVNMTAFSAHDTANLLKRYVNSLPRPLITADHRAAFMAAFDEASFEDQIRAFRKHIAGLAPIHRHLLLYLLDLSALLASHSDKNGATTTVLSMAFARPIFGDISRDVTEAQQSSYLVRVFDIVVFLINNQDHFLLGFDSEKNEEKEKENPKVTS